MSINIKPDDLIYPYFVISGKNKKQKINSFEGIFRFSIDRLLKDIKEIKSLGINKILLFGIPDTKDARGSAAYKKDSIAALAVKNIKDKFPDLIVITDVCLCAYTSHGHCGIIEKSKIKNKKSKIKSIRQDFYINNKKTLEVLAKIALLHAQAGVDFVAPSAMAKRQVFAIRKSLDKNGYKKTKILGYSAKFASNFYGPFRNACNSSPLFGDRSGYQLNYLDSARALDEIKEDIKEEADIVMVKPALAYLDIIRQAREKFKVPLASYNVSGEYTFVKYGAKQGLWDEKKMVFEIISSIKRAGADFIISYHAKDIAEWLNDNDK